MGSGAERSGGEEGANLGAEERAEGVYECIIFFSSWLIAFSVVAFCVLAMANDQYHGHIPIESDFLNRLIYGFALLVWRSAAVELKLRYQMRNRMRNRMRA